MDDHQGIGLDRLVLRPDVEGGSGPERPAVPAFGEADQPTVAIRR